MKENLFSPTKGVIIPLNKTNDPVFSNGTMGQGFGLIPKSNQINAPVTGEVTMVADTKHAIGIHTSQGLDILIHMGIDTVELKGKGFQLAVHVGDSVNAGDPLATMDLPLIKEKGYDTTIMVIVTNSDQLTSLEVNEGETENHQLVAQALLKENKKTETKQTKANLAESIVTLVGGKENINSVIHCFTRLRFDLKEENKAKTDNIKALKGVIDVIQASGQYQVVIGQGVDAVFEDVIALIGNKSAPVKTENQEKNPFKRWGSELIGVITGSMSPVVGVIMASGIIKGILALLTLPQLGAVLSVDSHLYITISAMADAAFFFLPVLVGFAAAKRLDADPMITAVVGAFLTYPQMVEWGTKGQEMFQLFGLHFDFINYTYSIFPMIVAAWLVKVIGNFLKKHLPTYVRSILIPLLTILIVATITIVVTGPIIQNIANGLATLINWIVDQSGWLGGLIIGGFYQLLVIFGLHWGVVPLVAQQIASTGQTPLNAIISVTMVAQGAAVLAVAIKSKKAEMKELGYGGAISAFCGITEPAIYGVNLRYKRVFASGLIGSACGGLITGLMHGTMYGFTGSLIGFSSFFNPNHPTDLNSFYAFLISSAVAIIVSFAVTWVWGYNDDMTMGKKVEKKKRPGSK